MGRIFFEANWMGKLAPWWRLEQLPQPQKVQLLGSELLVRNVLDSFHETVCDQQELHYSWVGSAMGRVAKNTNLHARTRNPTDHCVRHFGFHECCRDGPPHNFLAGTRAWLGRGGSSRKTWRRQENSVVSCPRHAEGRQGGHARGIPRDSCHVGLGCSFRSGFPSGPLHRSLPEPPGDSCGCLQDDQIRQAGEVWERQGNRCVGPHPGSDDVHRSPHQYWTYPPEHAPAWPGGVCWLLRGWSQWTAVLVGHKLVERGQDALRLQFPFPNNRVLLGHGKRLHHG